MVDAGAEGTWERRVRRWYESGLGWETAPGTPVRLRTGVRFDVLDVPAEAGRAALWRLGGHAPVALRGDRMLLLVAAGSAEELPGLLEWLEWGTLPLDLSARGAGELVEAPVPWGMRGPREPRGPAGDLPRGGCLGRCGEGGLPEVASPEVASPQVASPEVTSPEVASSARGAGGGGEESGAGVEGGLVGVPAGGPGGCCRQGAAVWLRPPVPGGEVEASLPTLSAPGDGGGAPGLAPDLVRLVDTVATHCHRVRLRGAGGPRSQRCR
ncbi:SCO3374 family protein [Streptomyces sp. NPDC023723]|uniref:SCO3374 family protein n=1 Tax=Streptomyces sp. NPDC023723 TaxID=3154323 RepID=UPI0033CDE56F